MSIYASDKFIRGVVTLSFNFAYNCEECIIRIICTFVLDNEAPSVLYCPTTQHIKITSTDKMVKWPKAQFRDNVGVVSVKSNLDFGERPAGTYPILFTARDKAGNTARCRFNVIVNGISRFS